MKNKRRESAAASTEVDWSELPTELLNLIFKRLRIEIDLIRFRSVCSNWRRSSSISNHRYKRPLHKLTFDIGTFFCYFTLQNIFLIKPPPHQTLLRPWLVRITKCANGKTKLLRPFLRYSSPIPFPFVIDFNDFSVLPLKTNLIAQVDFAHKNQSYEGDSMFPQKFNSVRYHERKPQVLGTLSYSVAEKYECSKFGNEPWRMIFDVWPKEARDFCLFKGERYAVDGTGRTIRCCGCENLAAEPLVDGGGCLKFLVVSDGNLLLADVYYCSCNGFANHDPARMDLSRIDLFELNEKEKKWVRLMSLGDKVLILGEGCSFSVSASDLHVARGNCVIFKDNILHLDEGRLSPLSDYPEYDNLFWPPPEWVFQS